MEDDRIAENADGTPLRLDRRTIGVALSVILLALIVRYLTAHPPAHPPESATPGVRETVLAKFHAVPMQPLNLSIQEYTRLCTPVDDTGAPGHLSMKDLIRSPDSFTGRGVKLTAKVMRVDEEEGKTLIAVYLNSNFEVGLVAYDGVVQVRPDDVIEVLGVASGLIHGTNALGEKTGWPAINGRFVTLKSRSRE